MRSPTPQPTPPLWERETWFPQAQTGSGKEKKQLNCPVILWCLAGHGDTQKQKKLQFLQNSAFCDHVFFLSSSKLFIHQIYTILYSITPDLYCCLRNKTADSLLRNYWTEFPYWYFLSAQMSMFSWQNLHVFRTCLFFLSYGVDFCLMVQGFKYMCFSKLFYYLAFIMYYLLRLENPGTELLLTGHDPDIGITERWTETSPSPPTV